MNKTNTLRRQLVIGALALPMAACAAIQGRETAGEYVDDATLSAKVRAEIVRDPNLKMGQVGVETMQGVVQLSGFVPSKDLSVRAEQIARRVDGVRGVKNDLVVR